MDEKRELFLETLDNCLEYISRSVVSGLHWHGHREIIWKQVYDLSAWWKMLELSGTQGDGDYCPFCDCTLDDDHLFEHWKNLPFGSVWRNGVQCITSFSP